MCARSYLFQRFVDRYSLALTLFDRAPLLLLLLLPLLLALVLSWVLVLVLAAETNDGVVSDGIHVLAQFKEANLRDKAQGKDRERAGKKRDGELHGETRSVNWEQARVGRATMRQ